METIVVGSAFVAKYPEGGGNFSVPLQYILGLKRMGLPCLWLEVMEASQDHRRDLLKIEAFHRRLQKFDLQDTFCLLLMPGKDGEQDPKRARFFGKTVRQFLDIVGGPCVLLNLRSHLINV